jgi:hypothetical protein
MTESPWLSLAIVWLVVLVLGGVLWQRFTRVPAQSRGLASRAPATTRRVVPLWLALVLLVLIISAVWLTVRWGAPLWSGRPVADSPTLTK